MSTFAVLDHVAHATLKVKHQYGEAFGDNINQALVFPTEFQSLLREYPIFFRQLDDKRFYAVVILGLDRDENLFLDADRWDARYVPAMQMKGPFALGVLEDTAESADKSDPLVQINEDDARVNQDEGERIFLTHGGYSPYLEEILKALQKIYTGSSIADAFFEHLQSFNLIEPITVQASFGENRQYTIPDVFTISRSRMAALTADELHTLNELGLLEHCFAVLASAENMSRIVDMKVKKNPQLA